jgi:hypothetical protein
VRKHRRHRLAGEARASARGRAERDTPARLERGDLRRALDELDGGAASAAGGETLVAEFDAGTLGDLTGTRCPMRVDESAERLEGARRHEQLIVAPPGCLVEPQHVGERRAELLECVAGAGHVYILPGTTDIHTTQKGPISL